MAFKNIKGLTVEIGGDTTKLGKALEDVNKKSRDLTAELGDINRLLKMDPGNTDLLAQKQKVLAEAISNTSEKLDKLKEAERQVQQQFERGEASEEQVRELQREIIATENKMQSYVDAARETADEIDRLGDDANDTGDDLDDLGDDLDKAEEELEDAEKEASNFGDALKKAGEIAAKAFGAVVTATSAAVTALAGATVSAAAYADDMLTMSTVTGMTTDDLQAFSYAAGLLDVEVETISKSMAKNIKSMASAADGSAAYADAYKQLGINVTDANGELRDSEEVYWETIDALGQVANETERDALAMQLFGKSAQELNPLIEAGADKINELKQEAEDVGAVLSEETLEALGSFDDSLQRLKGGAGAAKKALGGVLLPSLQLLTDSGADLLSEFTQNLNATGGGMEGLVETVSNMSDKIVDSLTEIATELLDQVAALAPTLVTVGMNLITSLATALINMAPQILELGVQIITTMIQGLTQAIPQIAQALTNIIPQLSQALITGIPLLIQGASQLFLAILDAIPEIIPPLVDAIPDIVMALVDGLADAIPELLEGALAFLMAIVEAIPLIIEQLVPVIPDIVQTICDVLTENIPTLLDGAVQLLNAIIEAIPIMIDALIPVIPDIINTIIECLLENLPVLLQCGVTLFTSLVRAIPQMIPKLIEALPEIANTILDALGDIIPAVFEIGCDIVRGLWEGIQSLASWLWDKVSGWIRSIWDGICSFFGIKSPSREMAWVGKMLDEGLAKGVEQSADLPAKAAQDMADSVMEAADDTLGGLEFERNLSLSGSADLAAAAADSTTVVDLLTGIYDRLGRLQIVLDTGALVGETIEKINAALGGMQLLRARGV